MRILSKNEIEEKWKGSCSHVFSGGIPPENPFIETAWKMALLPRYFGFMDRVDFDALKQAAEAVGDDEFAVLDAEDQFPDEPTRLLSWDWDNFDWIGRNTVYGHIIAYVIGGSAKWGLVASYDLYSVLGGTSEFMAEFFRHAGGEESVKRRMIKSIDQGEVGFGDEGKAFAAELLDLVGWK